MYKPMPGFYCISCKSYINEEYLQGKCPKCGSTHIIELTQEDLYDNNDDEEDFEEMD